jgi:serine-threonine kinase receptor-associated protein
VWDTFSGDVLHSFPHDHIVRTVALSPGTTHLLTGGHEKKVRIFDLGRPDADPVLLLAGGDTSHEGTLKSVVWIDDRTGASAGEDGLVKCV